MKMEPIANNKQSNTRYDRGCDPLEHDDEFLSVQLRVDHDLNDEIVITSLTSYNDFEQKGSGMDGDGSIFYGDIFPRILL